MFAEAPQIFLQGGAGSFCCFLARKMALHRPPLRGLGLWARLIDEGPRLTKMLNTPQKSKNFVFVETLNSENEERFMEGKIYFITHLRVL